MTAKGNIETIHQTRSKQRTGILFSFILLIIQPAMFLVNFSGYIEENRSIRRCSALLPNMHLKHRHTKTESIFVIGLKTK